MLKLSRYIYNKDTLLYEKHEESGLVRVLRFGVFALCVAVVVFVNFWAYTSLFGFDLPKTAHLKKINAEWQALFELMDHELDVAEAALLDIEQRDDDVYRSIFGLEEIPAEVKNAGFGGVNRYAYLDELGGSELLKSTARRMDVMTKRSYVQSNALDEVSIVSKQAGDMLSCVPAVCPILPVKGKYRISSSYGRRNDPVYRGRQAFHDGIDIATALGTPVYATGDGVVEKVRYQFFGYGNEIVINHGFGYKTRYAHLNSIDVVRGQKIVRGERIGSVGNTGKSTGPHLHYEVLYRTKSVNPNTYLDFNIKPEEYASMVNSVSSSVSE